MLAIIPAKGASTRLPRKNDRLLGGKPLVVWTIESALGSGVFSQVIVSSEDAAILEIARNCGATAQPRPARLAVDPAGCIHVAQYVVAELGAAADRFGQVVILMPTCPFRSADDIRNAAAIAAGTNGGCVYSVSEFSHTPYNALSIADDGHLEPLWPDAFGGKSQELPPAYRPNGAVFIMSLATLRAAKSLFEEPMTPYVMPPERSIDIDREMDLAWAEFMLQRSGNA